MATWYYRKDGANQGPIDDAKFQDLLASGEIDRSTFVWQPSWPDWKAYGAIDSPQVPPIVAPAPSPPPTNLAVSAPPLLATPSDSPPPAGHKHRNQLILAIVLACAAIIALVVVVKLKSGATEENPWGVLLAKDKCEIYRKPGITERETEKVMRLIAGQVNCSENRVSFQLTKNGGRVAFRMVTKKEAIHDKEIQNALRVFGDLLSKDVFGGTPVDVHLCDEYFSTVVPLPHKTSGDATDTSETKVDSSAKRVSRLGCEVYYEPPVTLENAKKTLDLLILDDSCDGTPKSFKISREGTTYIFKMVTKTEYYTKVHFHHAFRAFVSRLASQAYDGAKTEAHICDNQLRTVHKFTTFDVELEGKCVFFFDPSLSSTVRKGMKTWLISEGCSDPKDYFLVRVGEHLEIGMVVSALDPDLRATIKSYIPSLPGRLQTPRKVSVRIYDLDYKTLGLIQ